MCEETEDSSVEDNLKMNRATSVISVTDIQKPGLTNSMDRSEGQLIPMGVQVHDESRVMLNQTENESYSLIDDSLLNDPSIDFDSKHGRR